MKRDNNNIFIISILALLISVGAICAAFVNVTVTITHETFVGIIATFMGVSATFMVGYQIFNSIMFNRDMDILKNKIEDLNKKSNDLDIKINTYDKKISDVNHLIIKMQISMQQITGILASTKGQNTQFVINMLNALLIILWNNQFIPNQKDTILQNLKVAVNTAIKQHGAPIDEAIKIKKLIKRIKTNPNYIEIQDEFEPIMQKIKKWIINNYNQ